VAKELHNHGIKFSQYIFDELNQKTLNADSIIGQSSRMPDYETEEAAKIVEENLKKIQEAVVKNTYGCAFKREDERSLNKPIRQSSIFSDDEEGKKQKRYEMFRKELDKIKYFEDRKRFMLASKAFLEYS
jgi:hypothetical protein